mgnify:CR=1 FL=1
MIFKDYYEILEMQTNKVSIEQIRSNYRELAKKYHPDVNTGKDAEEKFKDINEAYRVLSDTSARRKYDRMWHRHVGNKRKKEYEESQRSADSRFSDFFNMFFGNIEEKIKGENSHNNQSSNAKKIAIRGENIETEINISIEEAFYGLNKKISLRAIDGKMKTFSIKVPAGIRNNEKIRLIGQGKAGENGGRNGDLFIKINIENNTKFKLKGYDLYTDLLLTPWEAALGTRATVKSIDEEASLYVPQGIQSGEKVRIPGKGYKDGKGGRGDLVAEVKVMVPKKMTKEEKEMFKKLSEISEFDPRKVYS